MFTQKTLFVVGAGASLELGLPSGDVLKGTIAKKLDFDVEFGSVKKGNRDI